jgi:diguanylate cyclase (GGDEF)-like protein
MSQPPPTVELPAALAQAENLPSLPTVALEVLRLADSPDTTLEDLARTLAVDPALAAKILRLSNSAAFSTRSEITSLNRACMVLGFKAVKLMALSFSLCSSLKGESTGAFDYELFWRRSVVCATAGRELARAAKRALGDEAFLCGLLGRLGQLVMARCLPVEYHEVIDQSGDAWPTPESERAVLGFSGEDVSAALFRSWSIPSLIATALACRRTPETLPAGASAQTVELCRLAQVAWLCEGFLCGPGEPEQKAQLEQAAERYFGLDVQAVERLLVDLQVAILETAELLDIHVGFFDVPGMIARAQKRLAQVSLGVAIENRQAELERDELTSRNKELADKAHTDKLTGLPNRAYFDEVLTTCVRQRLLGRSQKALGLLMLDVDRFKDFNDTHGHQTGDEVLRMVGRVINGVKRGTDVAARYGGEEFAVIMPETTHAGLGLLAERIRSEIERHTLEVGGQRLKITVSIGGACVEHFDQDDGGAQLVRAADKLLYTVKRGGRNGVALSPGTQL